MHDSACNIIKHNTRMKLFANQQVKPQIRGMSIEALSCCNHLSSYIWHTHTNSTHASTHFIRYFIHPGGLACSLVLTLFGTCSTPRGI